MEELTAHLTSLKLEEFQDAPLGLVDLVVDKTRSTIRTTSDLKLAAPECQTHFIAKFVINTPKILYEEAKDLIRFHVFDEKIGSSSPHGCKKLSAATSPRSCGQKTRNCAP